MGEFIDPGLASEISQLLRSPNDPMDRLLSELNSMTIVRWRRAEQLRSDDERMRVTLIVDAGGRQLGFMRAITYWELYRAHAIGEYRPLAEVVLNEAIHTIGRLVTTGQ